MTRRNASIDIFRYIGAIMVVAIHTNPLAEISPFIAESILTFSRLATPFFFATSGYYFIKRYKEGFSPFPSLLKIFKSYCIWSAIYFVFDFITWGHGTIKGFIVNCIYTFFVLGSHYHLWYIVALIFAICISSIFLRYNKENLLLLISGILWYFMFSSSGLLTTIVSNNFLSGLPRFAVGILAYKINSKLTTSTVFPVKSICIFSLSLWTICFLFQLIPDIFISLGLYITVCILLITLLRHPLSHLHCFSRKCRSLSDFTYYAHPLVIEILSIITPHYSCFEISHSQMFVLTVLITWAISSCITMIRERTFYAKQS